MKKETGGQAFPTGSWEYDGQGNVLPYQENGMTLRDYFAAKTMQGFCSHHAIKITPENIDTHAKIAYRIADAMLKARDQ